MVDPEKLPELRRKVEYLLLNAPFQVAKTMPEIPHSYTLRRKWGKNEKFFENVVEFIREFGVKEFFGRKQFVYYYLDGYKYWSMGWPAKETILINRAKADSKQPDEKDQ